MKYLYAFAALAVLIGAAAWSGHYRGYDDGVAATQAAADKKVHTAQADQRRAEAERDAAVTAVTNVKRELTSRKRELDQAKYFADIAMGARNDLQQQLDAATRARTVLLRKLAHESPPCADLARLPVCPAVAERLWGKTAAGEAAPGH